MQQTTESQNWVDEDGAALERLLRQRHSVRGFLARPIPAPLLTRVFELAQLAPSNVNAQPWRVDVLSGGDRKSTRLTPVTNAHLVCRLLLEKTTDKKKQKRV